MKASLVCCEGPACLTKVPPPSILNCSGLDLHFHSHGIKTRTLKQSEEHARISHDVPRPDECDGSHLSEAKDETYQPQAASSSGQVFAKTHETWVRSPWGRGMNWIYANKVQMREPEAWCENVSNTSTRFAPGL